MSSTKRSGGARAPSRARYGQHPGRRPLLLLAGLRAVLGLVAIPLVPALYEDHFAFLVLLRPTKEVLLAAGFFIRRGEVNPLAVLLTSVPLGLLGVWLLYAIGRSYADEIHEEDGLPRWARRFLPKDRIDNLTHILERK